MNYIEMTLGVKVTTKNWRHIDKIPYYILDRYDIKKASIDSIDALFLHAKYDLDKVKTIEAHILRIQKEERVPVVLILNKITPYQRRALIKARIPFVVQEKQLYLPFLGVFLQERFSQDIVVEQLQPAAQVLLYYYIYQKNRELYISQAVKDLGYSAMTISRATKQLVKTGMFQERKDGVQIVLSAELSGRDLFEKLRPYMIDPVRKKAYVLKSDVDESFCVAGDGALAHYTMLNEPKYQCYAVESKYPVKKYMNMIDMDEYVEVEFWKYDPKLFCRDQVVDPLSLAMSMNKESDERVETEIEELLDSIWRE